MAHRRNPDRPMKHATIAVQFRLTVDCNKIAPPSSHNFGHHQSPEMSNRESGESFPNVIDNVIKPSEFIELIDPYCVRFADKRPLYSTIESNRNVLARDS
jgi:hypothetical protein